MFVALLFVFRLFFIIIEIVLGKKRGNLVQLLRAKGKGNPIWLSWRYKIIAALIGLLGLIFALVTFIRLEGAEPGINDQCRANVDGDIGGIGVRAAFWVQEGISVLSALTGIFHDRPTAAKEVGAGLVITQTSLSMALLVQMRQGLLSPVNAAVGLMILDAQNLALSIQLSVKDMLAARWQAGTVLCSQLIGLVTIAVLMDFFNRGRSVAEGCACFSFFWWAWLHSCSPVLLEMATFWVYYGFRCLNFIHDCYFCLTNCQEFHRIEKDDMTRFDWEEVESTSDFTFFIGAVFALTSMAAAEIAIRDYGLYPPSLSFTIGQVTAIVIAGLTLIRVTWVFVFRLFVARAKKA
jgi:hypothetical protein